MASSSDERSCLVEADEGSGNKNGSGNGSLAGTFQCSASPKKYGEMSDDEPRDDHAIGPRLRLSYSDVGLNMTPCLSQTGRDPERPPGFFDLIWILLIPFGGHFFKSAQSGIHPYLLARGFMDGATYGTMLSLFALPNMLIPVFGGHLLDARQSTGQWATVGFICVAASGMFLYTVAWGIVRSIPLTAVGAVLYGTGEGCVVVAARAAISHMFYGHGIAMAQGAMVAASNLSGMLAKTVVPYLFENVPGVGEHWLALSCFLVTQGISLCAGVMNAASPSYDSSSPPPPTSRGRGSKIGKYAPIGSDDLEAVTSHADPSTHASDPETPQRKPRLSADFWFVSILHAIFVVVFKVFDNFSNGFVIERFGANPVKAGFISSLSKLFALLAPMVGFLTDRYGHERAILSGAAMISTASFALLAFAIHVSPVVGILGLSLAHANLPFLLLAAIPSTVPKTQFGIAFGISEILVASGHVILNPAFGYVRDVTGSYDLAVQALFVLSLVGTVMIGLGCGFRNVAYSISPQ